VVRDGTLVDPVTGDVADLPDRLGTFRMPDVALSDLAIPASGGDLRAIGVFDGSLLTEERHLPPRVDGGRAVADPARDLAKVAVLDRHRGERFSLGFLQGLGLQRGAIATSVGHDAHNLCTVGMDDADMLAAARHVQRANGGMAVVRGGEVRASLDLPLAGLMSDQDLDHVTAALRGIRGALAELGTEREVFMPLSFVQLSVIPTLRLTDHGLVDVEAQQFRSLWVG